MSERAQVIVVDDDDAVRDSLAFLFRSGGYEVRSYGSAQEALAGLDRETRGCVVTDVRMPGMSGIDLLRELRASVPVVSVIVITGHGDVGLAVEAMKAGAVDFLEKPFPDEALLSAVREALATPNASGVADDARNRIARLTQREREVLTHLVNGELNKTVAHELGISMRTVEVYRANIMAKVRVDSFAELVRVSLRAGVGAI
jgi:two-component system response regulator FixJ